MFDRLEKLIGIDGIEIFKNASVLLVGLGGVGGYAFENLVRCGFGHITVIDMDIFEESNLNRQVLATLDVLGKKKVDVAKKRAESIHKACEVTILHKSLTKDDICHDFLKTFDYVIDACDTTSVKVALIEVCTKYKIKLVSSMGTANRILPECLEITTLEKTRNDPLAKVIRREFRQKKECLKTKVICSKEIPLKQKALGTICSVPMVAGAYLSSVVIQDLLSNKF